MKHGRQEPTRSVFLNKRKTPSRGEDAIELYEKSGRTAQPWQKKLVHNMLSYDKNGIWIHSKFGYSVPRRNGKSEILTILEIYGLMNGMQIMHTAHRTTTSTSSFERLYSILCDSGLIEGGKGKSKDEDGNKIDADFKATRQKGLERITMAKKHGGGLINFRTRSGKGGLGEGYDMLIVDEAQEYTDDHDSALKYIVSDAANPITIYTGTAPTAVSSGTVFVRMRNETLTGGRKNTGWAEWSVDKPAADIRDRSLWYLTNPAMGYQLNERKIEDELNGDEMDFQIQRLGLWLEYNQKSAIAETDWDAIKLNGDPEIKGRLFAGIKYGKDGTNVSLSIAAWTAENRIFVETIDCRNVRDGNLWLLNFLKNSDIARTVVDGANGQQILADEMKAAGIPKAIFPTVSEIIKANASFESNLSSGVLCHSGQPSLKAAATNCDKRPIGANGGFGYKSIRDDVDVSILDSAILAQWVCMEHPDRPKIKVSGYR